MKRFIPLTALALAFGFGAFAAFAADQPAASTDAANGADVVEAPGKDVFLKDCTQCHAVNDVVAQRKNRATWDLKLREMKGYGADFSDDDGKIILDYLSMNYGL